MNARVNPIISKQTNLHLLNVECMLCSVCCCEKKKRTEKDRKCNVETNEKISNKRIFTWHRVYVECMYIVQPRIDEQCTEGNMQKARISRYSRKTSESTLLASLLPSSLCVCRFQTRLVPTKIWWAFITVVSKKETALHLTVRKIRVFFHRDVCYLVCGAHLVRSLATVACGHTFGLALT